MGTQFVGREQELVVLTAALAGACACRPPIMLCR